MFAPVAVDAEYDHKKSVKNLCCALVAALFPAAVSRALTRIILCHEGARGIIRDIPGFDFAATA